MKSKKKKQQTQFIVNLSENNVNLRIISHILLDNNTCLLKLVISVMS